MPRRRSPSRERTPSLESDDRSLMEESEGSGTEWSRAPFNERLYSGYYPEDGYDYVNSRTDRRYHERPPYTGPRDETSESPDPSRRRGHQRPYDDGREDMTGFDSSFNADRDDIFSSSEEEGRPPRIGRSAGGPVGESPERGRSRTRSPVSRRSPEGSLSRGYHRNISRTPPGSPEPRYSSEERRLPTGLSGLHSGRRHRNYSPTPSPPPETEYSEDSEDEYRRRRRR